MTIVLVKDSILINPNCYATMCIDPPLVANKQTTKTHVWENTSDTSAPMSLFSEIKALQLFSEYNELVDCDHRYRARRQSLG